MNGGGDLYGGGGLPPVHRVAFDYDYDDEYYFEDDDKYENNPRTLYYDKYDVV